MVSGSGLVGEVQQSEVAMQLEEGPLSPALSTGPEGVTGPSGGWQVGVAPPPLVEQLEAQVELLLVQVEEVEVQAVELAFSFLGA